MRMIPAGCLSESGIKISPHVRGESLFRRLIKQRSRVSPAFAGMPEPYVNHEFRQECQILGSMRGNWCKSIRIRIIAQTTPVNCRIGSLEKKKLRSSSMEKVNCRIGSLETSVCESVVLLGCVTEGDTLSEAIDMAGDALGIYLYSLKKTKRLIRSRLIRLISRQKAVTLLF